MTPKVTALPLSGLTSDMGGEYAFWRGDLTLSGQISAPERVVGVGSGARTIGPMPIEIDIAHVARLARLGLDDDELESYRAQLGVILEHAARVQSLEVEPDVEAVHPLEMSNAFRDDEPTPSLDRFEVLTQAPETIDGFFVVPPAMETE